MLTPALKLLMNNLIMVQIVLGRPVFEIDVLRCQHVAHGYRFASRAGSGYVHREVFPDNHPNGASMLTRMPVQHKTSSIDLLF